MRTYRRWSALSTLAWACTAGAQSPTCTADNTVHADVVAIDMPMVFNRLGAQNVNWQMYALKHDLVVREPDKPPRPATDADIKAAVPLLRLRQPSHVTLRPDLRPRPLVLRVAAGECLSVRLTNLLATVSNPFEADQQLLPSGHPMEHRSHDERMKIDDQVASRRVGFHPNGLQPIGSIASDSSHAGANASSLVGPGQSASYTFFAPAEGSFLVSNPGAAFGGEGTAGTSGTGLFATVAVQPVGGRAYRGQVTEEELRLATRLLKDPAIGGAAVLPCVGRQLPERACIAQPDGRAGPPVVDYAATYPDEAPWNAEGKAGLPILAMEQRGADGRRRIVHGDLNAIVLGPEKDGSFPRSTYPLESTGATNPTLPNRLEAFREFVSVFHDENATAQAFPALFDDPVLGHTLHGVRDAFMINYGSGGVGAEVVANRLAVGPMHDCVDCAFEEFFLSSFTVGDPALLVDRPANLGLEPLQAGRLEGPDLVGVNLHGKLASGVQDQLADLAAKLKDRVGTEYTLQGPKATKAFYPHDPANVHHSYLGDFVKFRNLHTGKEQHIFHLHNHQWLFNPNDDNANYIDAQAIGPGSGYTYEIAFGGSGNRNKSAGDAVFHCHYYPHFAQGMWYLWRIHDTFEAGTVLQVSGGADGVPGIHRTPYALADGQPAKGARALPDGEIVAGTPIPAVVPLPGKALAPVPGRVEVAANPALSPHNQRPIGSLAKVTERERNPGFPFWIAGIEDTVGSRPTTPPLDMHASVGGTDGGVPRHAVFGYSAGSASQDSFTRLDATKKEKAAKPRYFPETGTDLEQLAMKFHAQSAHASTAVRPDGQLQAADFVTNGGRPEPGAPFFDPCVDDRRQRLSAGVQGRYFGSDGSTSLADASPFDADTPRIYKGANIQLDVTINKLGDHYPQQRILALWEDVDATLATGFRTLPGAGDVKNPRPPEPLVLRMNTFDCARYLHTNLVPKEFEMDDYQVRTPTDVIGQHIHLPKWDLPSADGSANGWNYEDGTFSPGMVRSRIHAINEWNKTNPGAAVPNPYAAGQPAHDPARAAQPGDALVPQPHYFFGRGGPFQLTAEQCVRLWHATPYAEFNNEKAGRPGSPGQCDWLGARTTLQRWFSDPVVNKEHVHRGLGITFTHDHLGPSTHQQVGLYATMLTEPPRSTWVHNESGELLYSRGEPGTDCSKEFAPGAPTSGRCDGGPTSWQAVIRSADEKLHETHREFFLQFGDFQHAYRKHEFRGVDAQGVVVAKADAGNTQSFRKTVTPSFRKPASPNFPDVVALPASCPGGADQLEPAEAKAHGALPSIPRPCPEVISADDIGTMVVNYRQEPVAARVLQLRDSAGTDRPVHAPGDAQARQSPGPAGDLAYAYQSRTDRRLAALNDAKGDSPYDLLTHDVRPGDPYTPIVRAYSGDLVRIKIQAGSHEHEHTGAINGLKWLQAGSGYGQSPQSGWRGSQNIGLSEQFTLSTRITDYAGNDKLHSTDRLYAIDSSQDGLWNGAWGLIRTLERRGARDRLVPLPANPQPTLFFSGDKSMRANDCPRDAPLRNYQLVAGLANQLLDKVPAVALAGVGGVHADGGTLVYNPRATEIRLNVYAEEDDPATPQDERQVVQRTERFGIGPLHDPTAILVVHRQDIDPATHRIKAGAPVEPVVLRAAAGECVQVTLENRLPLRRADMPDLAGFTTLSMLMPQRLDGGSGEHASFNNNRVRPSNRIGLHPQMLQYDVQHHDGSVVGFNTRSLAGPGEQITYKWYAGELSFSMAAARPDLMCGSTQGAEAYEPFNQLREVLRRNADGQPRMVRPPNQRFTLEVLSARLQKLVAMPMDEDGTQPAADDTLRLRAAAPFKQRPLVLSQPALRSLRTLRPALATNDLAVLTPPPAGMAAASFDALLRRSLQQLVELPALRACLEDPAAGATQTREAPTAVLGLLPAELQRALRGTADSAQVWSPDAALSSTETLGRREQCAATLRTPVAEALKQAFAGTAAAPRTVEVATALADSIAYLVPELDDDALDSPTFPYPWLLRRESTRLSADTTRLATPSGPGCRFAAIEFGGINLSPPDRIKQGQKAAVGAFVVEPRGSFWWELADDRALDRQNPGPAPGATRQARTSAHVLYPVAGLSALDWHFFRDLVTVHQKGLNQRYGKRVPGKSSAVGALAAERVDTWMPASRVAPEDAHDAGQMAINYGTEPLWYRFGIDPAAPFGHGPKASQPTVPGQGFGGFANAHQAFADACCASASHQPAPSPGTPTAGPYTPVFGVPPHAEARLRMLMPTGVGRGSTMVLHGHGWQRDPYLAERSGPKALTLPYFAAPGQPLPGGLHLAAGTPVQYGTASQCQGRSALGLYAGAQDSISPTAHFDWLLEGGGGTQGLPGDYLLRDIAGFGVTSGLWALMRVQGEAMPVALRQGLRTSCE
ncbi:MAG: cupredoxin domain-containing protein [Pseudorhodoferax sp.]